MVKIVLFTLLSFLLSFELSSQDANGRFYSAGEIQSKNEVTYGRIEMLMYSSDMSGTTSTFFMWKEGGQAELQWNEIDIETFGKDPNRWQSNPIWEYSDEDTDTKRWEEDHVGLPIANNWVKFTLEWTPDYIAWFNNDVEVRRIVKGENVPDTHFRYNNGDSDDPVGNIKDPMRISFNHWATFPGDWLGPFNPADLPSFQFVDWLTYQPWNGTGFDEVQTRMDFNNLDEVISDFHVSTHTFGDNQCTFTPENVGVVNGLLWLSVTGYNDARAPLANEIPEEDDFVVITHDLPGLVSADKYSKQLGLQFEDVINTEGTGRNLGYTDSGDFIEYSVKVLVEGEYLVKYRVASLNGNASFSLKSDDNVLNNSVQIASTGGWQSWETISDTVYLERGEQILRLEVEEAGFNLYSIQFEKIDVLSNIFEREKRLEIFPNPASKKLYLSYFTNWEVYDAYGKSIEKGTSNCIDLERYDKGLFYLKYEHHSVPFTVY